MLLRIRGRGSFHCEQAGERKGFEAPIPLQLAVTADADKSADFLTAVIMALKLLTNIRLLAFRLFCLEEGLPLELIAKPNFSFGELGPGAGKILDLLIAHSRTSPDRFCQ